MSAVSRESYLAEIRNLPFEQLLTSVIHDVQNRNQTIMAASSLLKEDTQESAEIDPEQIGEYIELITASAHEISAMLRACDDYLKIRQKKDNA